MTPIYSCCDKCKHPTYTQCLATRASPYWVCPAAGLHCLVDCVTKHDPNRKKSTTRFRSRFIRTRFRSRIIRTSFGRKKPQKVKKLKCTEIVTVNGKKCTKQLCVSLIQPTNGWILVAQNRYSTRSPTLRHFFVVLVSLFTAAILLAEALLVLPVFVCRDLSCHKALWLQIP